MEIWKAVPGWEGFYEVSSIGRVRSLDRSIEVVNRFGNIETRRQRGQILKPGKIKNGYFTVSLTKPGGERRYAYVHHLVAEAFIGPRPEGKEVCHNDGVRTHNQKDNIRYDTRSANALDRHGHGTMNQARGEAHYFRKLSENDVRWIRKMHGVMSRRELSRMLGVTHGTVCDVLNGVSWKHVTPS